MNQKVISLPLITKVKAVSLPLIHHHLMMPWNDMREGECCGRLEAISDGYYCKGCDFFVHKKCCEFPQYIQHPSHHSGHTLELQSQPNQNLCDFCGKRIRKLFYRCDMCDFDVDLSCIMNKPPEVIPVSEMHHHKLTLLKEWIKFDCDARCEKVGEGFPYKCHGCDVFFHVNCVWNPPKGKHPAEYTIMDPEGTSVPLIMESEGVLLPFIHDHVMIAWNDLRKGDCCGRFQAVTDGYYCKSCDFFVHKKCGESPEYMEHPSHSHTLKLEDTPRSCKLCGKDKILNYNCSRCYFCVDLFCAKYPPPEVVDFPKMHQHKLTLLKRRVLFDCDAKCGKVEKGFSYKCHECDVSFHVDCLWNPLEGKLPSEVNHTYHPLHPLKLHSGQPPEYSDGKCRLCGGGIDDRLYYHCSTCNFSLDMRCLLCPPPQSVLDLKAHPHQLIIRPRLDSFTCNACGLSGDRSPYVCLQCDFMIHQNCLDLPRLININRHDHRVSRTSFLGVVDSICGICRHKMDWIWGGYSCVRCPQYVVHSKCATRKDVWNGKELEEVPEETEDIEPYLVIDENTIIHFSHKKHQLKFHVNGLIWEENKRCSACTHPVCLQPFYGCIDCNFFLHKNCAEFPKRKWHVFHNDRLTLVTGSENFWCRACERKSNGFAYKCGYTKLDVRCGAISEPFIHPSHPHHPLYYIISVEDKQCNGCNTRTDHVLACIESGCEFFLCFHCATLPQVVKHRVDDHPLSLCYGEEATGKYWCDICEKETNPRSWFYTCKDHRASLHKECVLGDCLGLMPGSTIKFIRTSCEVVLNNSVSRPLCSVCKLHCMYPMTMKLLGTLLGTLNPYICSDDCLKRISYKLSEDNVFVYN